MSRTASYSCRCTTTLTGPRKTTEVFVRSIHHEFLSTPGSLPWDVGLSSVQETRMSGVEHCPTNEWNRTGERSMLKFAESRHPVFRGTSPLSRGSLKSKGGGKVSIQFNAEAQTPELLFRNSCSQPDKYLRSSSALVQQHSFSSS